MDDLSKPYVPPTNRVLIKPTAIKKEKIRKTRPKTLYEIHEELLAEALQIQIERERLMQRLAELPPPIPQDM
jgi:hypothetical protein